MEEQLQKIRSWARKGTMKQFCTEITARLATHGYTAECSGDTVTCYRLREQKSGALGLGKKQVKEPVLTMVKQGPQISIPVESADAQFVTVLVSVLKER